MISPVSSPTVNEDPRNTTEIRPIFIYHRIRTAFCSAAAACRWPPSQARVALTERFSLIATKDGYAWINPSGGPELDGWANIALGAKGSIYQSEEHAIVGAGLRYEAPWGSRAIFQGRGKGLLNPFVSAAKGFGDFHAQLYTGPRLAIPPRSSSQGDGNRVGRTVGTILSRSGAE